jgi:hypothetical protein
VIAAAALSIALLLPAGAGAERSLARSPVILTPKAVISAFAAAGLPLRRISVSPHPPGQVVLYWVNYKTFSLTIFVEPSAHYAAQAYSIVSYSRSHDGWPGRLLRNVVVSVQPAGAKPGQAGRLRPMPVAVSRALAILSSK